MSRACNWPPVVVPPRERARSSCSLLPDETTGYAIASAAYVWQRTERPSRAEHNSRTRNIQEEPCMIPARAALALADEE